MAVGAENGFLDLPDRLLVADAFGRFEPGPPRTVTAEGEIVEGGQVLGVVRTGSDEVAVVCPCDAWVLAYLAGPGDRVRPGSPLVHLRPL